MSDDDQRFERGYRNIRRVSGGAESPWAGRLVADPRGEVSLLVDAQVLGIHWRGWQAAANGHVLRAVDVLRRSDGHDVLLPVCPERVSDFLDRRTTGRSAISAGESVTLTVSVLRGLCEAVQEQSVEPAPHGAWWLTDAGRPVIAMGSSTQGAVPATVSLLERLIGINPQLTVALQRSIDSIQRGHLAHELDGIESVLFATADPVPLCTTVFAPAAVRAGMLSGAAREVEDPSPPRAHWSIAFASHLDAEWADTLSQATTALWRRLRGNGAAGEAGDTAGVPRRRRAPWITAAAVGTAIVIGGLLWPHAAEQPAVAEPVSEIAPQPAATSSQFPAASGEAGPSEPEQVLPEELGSIVAELLTARTACAQEVACLTGIQEYSDRALPGGVIDLNPAERTITLLDDFGGVAVVRVDAVDTAASASAQLVVVAQIEKHWLLRDVHDITHDIAQQ